MADSFWQGTANGSTAVFSVPFPYIQPSDVLVQVNGVPMLTPGDFVWLTAGSVQFKVAPPNGTTVAIMRQTSPDAVDVSFNNGAVLTAADLNTAVLQCFYRTQELQDALNTYIGAGVARYSVTGANPFVTPSDLLTAAADAALQTTIATELLGAMTDISVNSSNILTNTNQISTLQATLDSLTSGVPGGIGTYLTNETNSRISGDTALQQQIDLIGAVNGADNAFVLNLATVSVDGVISLGTYLSALQATVAGNTAAITTEQSVRAAADSAAASSISTLNTTVGANSASITTLQTSVNGLDAQYVIRLDVNGNIAGFGLADGTGGTSEFTIVANKFAFIDPGNGLSTPTVPFSIISGVVNMQNVVIGGALIEDATIDTLKLGNNAVTEFYSASQSPVNSLWAYNALPTHITESASFTPGVNGFVRVAAGYLGSTDANTCLVQLEVYVKQNGIITYVQPMLANNLPDSGTDIEGTIMADLPVTAGLTTTIGLRGIGNGFNSAGHLHMQNSYVYGQFIKR